MTALPAAPSVSTPSERLAGFAALLRDHGLTVGVSEQQAMLQAAMHFGPMQEKPLQAAWRAIACHSQREWQLWPDVYERFWHPEKLRGGVKVSGQTRPSRSLRQSVQTLHDQMDAAQQPNTQPSGKQASPQTAGDTPSIGQDEQDAGTPRAQGGASRTEALHQRDGQPAAARQVVGEDRAQHRGSATPEPAVSLSMHLPRSLLLAALFASSATLAEAPPAKVAACQARHGAAHA